MKQLSLGAGKRVTIMAALAVTGAITAQLSANPAVNSAVIKTRIFNDFPGSTLTFSDLYPASITIRDDNTGNPPGFANLHNWRFSENNFTPAVFNNSDDFGFSADLRITGSANAEAGLQISPWWSQDVDGRLNVRVPDGEIAAFGGRLPFYSFTANYGLHYALGDSIRLGMVYDPNSLTAEDPATIVYSVFYNGTLYKSPRLAFDEGNAAEGHGTWGMLDDARVGGHHQPFLGTQGVSQAEWSNISFVPEPSSLLILLGGVVLARRRR